MFDMIVQCTCGQGNLLNDKRIIKLDIVCPETGEPLTLMYFKCQSCGQINVVQIDNVESRDKFEKLIKKVAKMAALKRKHGRMKQKEITYIAKIRTDLAEIRNRLKNDYQGKHFIVNGISYEIKIAPLANAELMQLGENVNGNRFDKV